MFYTLLTHFIRIDSHQIARRMRIYMNFHTIAGMQRDEKRRKKNATEILIIKTDDSNKNLFPFFAIFCSYTLFFIDSRYYCESTTLTQLKSITNILHPIEYYACCCCVFFLYLEFTWVCTRKNEQFCWIMHIKKRMQNKNWTFCAWWFWIFAPLISYLSHQWNTE